MPTYSYICDACGKSFEKEQRISEDPLKKCELCGKPKARRQIAAGNFILKGSGWYADLYHKPAGAKSETKSESTSDSSSSSTSTKTESAPKAESKPSKKKKD